MPMRFITSVHSTVDWLLLTAGVGLTVIGDAVPDASGWSSMLEKYGVMGGLVVLFVYWTRQRETSMGDRLTKSEDWIRDKLIASLDRNTTAFQELKDIVSKCPGHGQSKEDSTARIQT